MKEAVEEAEVAVVAVKEAVEEAQVAVEMAERGRKRTKSRRTRRLFL